MEFFFSTFVWTFYFLHFSLKLYFGIFLIVFFPPVYLATPPTAPLHFWVYDYLSGTNSGKSERGVTCHMSHVTCHMSLFFPLFFVCFLNLVISRVVVKSFNSHFCVNQVRFVVQIGSDRDSIKLIYNMQ